MQDALNDGREYNVFIPARFDDLGLTLEAFRVYCHLSRRCQRNTRTAYPSYTRIGEDCFRGSYPNSSPASLKAKAIAAVDELIAYGLIRKELYNEGDGFKHNIYHLTPQSEWKQPTAIASCNIRKGRPGLTRSKTDSVNQDNHPVNQDNPVNGSNSVNGDNRSRLTGITGSVNGEAKSVNPTPPKGITKKGNTNEGNTTKDLNFTHSGEMRELEQEAQFFSPQKEQPPVQTVDVEIVPIEQPHIEQSPPERKGKKPRAAKGSAAGKFSEEDFERFWEATLWKTGKDPAKRQFLAIPQNEPATLDEIIESWTAQQQYYLKKDGSLQYLKRPPTWIHNKSWTDQLEPVAAAGINPRDLAMAAEIQRQNERMKAKFSQPGAIDAVFRTV